MRKVLVIAPHPDDSVLGCGGTILKHVGEGDEVHICVVTKNYSPEWSADEIEEKRDEALRSSRILQAKNTCFLDFPTVKLDTIPQKELNDAILKVIREVEPEIVYAPHRGDLNKDHKMVFDAVMVATRPMSGVREILCYETLSSTEWGAPFIDNAFMPNVYVNITNTLDVKVKAMAEYKTELKNYPHPRSLEAISVLAARRGNAIGVGWAEAFMLVRRIWK